MEEILLKVHSDDEELYIPHGSEIKDKATRFAFTYSWVRYYNTLRSHYGKACSNVKR
ncbi:MAG: hypothetical protein ABIK67_08350 [candidate division WOR-3 bacterium]